MITLPTAAQNHLSGDVITIAFCIDITKTDGGVIRLTSHSGDIVIGGNQYYSDTGGDVTAIKLVNNMAIGGGDLASIISSSLITEDDILAGRYNGAGYKIFFVDYTDPDSWSVTLSTGILGEVKIEGDEFTTELRSLSQKLNKIVGEYYQPGCRAELYDTRCTVNPAGFSYNGSVTAVADRANFTTDVIQAANFFDYGDVIWQTGNNAGITSKIKTSDAAGGIVLFIGTTRPIQIGDTFVIREGCDKKFSTCKTKFSNHVNFRGEPHVPGIEKAFITRI